MKGAAVLCLLFLCSLASGVELPPLPYDYDALEPHISRQTLEIHHDRHHAKCVNTMNSMIDGTELADRKLHEIVKMSYGKDTSLFNNAAQSWNHAFYWKCMSPNGGGQPSGKLMELMVSSFGSFDEFVKRFKSAGNSAFGSGWAWLVFDGTSLSVTKTIGAGTPLVVKGSYPILTMDVWEHAYYLDYQNARGGYVDTFVEKLVNWDYVSDKLEEAMEVHARRSQEAGGTADSNENYEL